MILSKIKSKKPPLCKGLISPLGKMSVGQKGHALEEVGLRSKLGGIVNG